MLGRLQGRLVHQIGMVGVLVLMSFSALHAAECNQDVMAQGRAIADQRAQLQKTLTKMVARVDMQAVDIAGLPQAVQASLPPVPTLPLITQDGFDADGQPVFTCDDAGSAGDQPAALLARTEADAKAVAAYVEAVKARQTAIETAVASGDAVVAAVPPAEPAKPEPAKPEPPAATPPAAETPAPDAPTPPVPEEGDNQATPPADAVATGPVPMPDAENPYLYRRIITLPDAQAFADAAKPTDGTTLPTFSVMYVFDAASVAGKDWVQVSRSVHGGDAAWLAKDQTLDWSSMLVMQFAPRGKRNQVLFFENERLLGDIVKNYQVADEVKTIFEGLRAERDKVAEDTSYTPKWDDRLVAIEPESAVTFRNQPYILPILDFVPERFDNGAETMMLKVAAVPSNAEQVATKDTESFASSAADAAAADDVFRVGIVFVIDTTVSMSPFIEKTYQAVESFYKSAAGMESGSFVSFGVVAYRDAIDGAADENDYVTQIFQPLDTDAPPAQVMDTMNAVKEATKSNSGFKEDVFAGVNDAINKLDWSPFDARLIILIGDASGREGDDPLARDEGMTAGIVSELAIQNGISIIPVHLITPANTKAADAAIAEAQMREMARTGDTASDKYIALDASSDEAFGAALDKAAKDLLRISLKVNSGELAQPIDPGAEEPEPMPLPDEGKETLSKAIQHEIFRAQLESLATVGGGDAPVFLSGWAADRDLGNPDTSSLDVSVFLTRAQLSSLDKQVELLVDAFESNVDDPAAFFDRLQMLAAETATDPSVVRNNDQVAVETLMPAFLGNLPYRSEVLRLDRTYWTAKSSAERDAFIEALQAKRTVYKNLFNQTDLWVDFGAGDPSEEATPVPLRNLP